MPSLLTIDDLSIADIEHVFELADTPVTPLSDPKSALTAAYSFEGNSIRTRTTFLKALHALGIHAIEVPNFLKTREPVEHLAGYMDNWVDLYVLRDSDHERLASFIRATRRPVINAMTSHAHPCEVLADAYSIRAAKGSLTDLTYCIVGPTTNVLNSWHRLADVLGLSLVHTMPEASLAGLPESHQQRFVANKRVALQDADIVLTDAWPAGFEEMQYQLTLDDMAFANEDAWVIPCPPFNTAHELSEAVLASRFFAGYAQKSMLFPVQRAIIQHLIQSSR